MLPYWQLFCRLCSGRDKERVSPQGMALSQVTFTCHSFGHGWLHNCHLMLPKLAMLHLHMMHWRTTFALEWIHSWSSCIVQL